MSKNIKKKEKIKPSMIVWFIYSIGSRIYMFFKNRIKVNRKIFKKRNKKEGCIVIYNHASNQDHFLTTIGFGLTRASYVASSHFYYNKTLRIILNMVKAISKEQFKPDIGTIKKIKRALQQKLPITIAPAGQTTMHGDNLRIDKSIVKLLKMCDVDVYAIQLHGAYMAYPKWRKYRRRSPIFINFVKVFTKLDLKTLSDEEIYQKTVDAININDRKEIKEYGYTIQAKSLVKGMEDMLYLCPKCNKMDSILSYKNSLICSNCKNTMTMNKWGKFEGIGNECVVMEDEAVWYEFEKSKFISKLKDNTLYLEGNFDLYYGVNHEYILKKVGTGKVILTNSELYYKGTMYGKEIRKDFKLANIYQIPFETRNHFDLPDDEGYYEFKPTEKEKTTIITKFVQAIDVIAQIRNENEYE